MHPFFVSPMPRGIAKSETEAALGRDLAPKPGEIERDWLMHMCHMKKHPGGLFFFSRIILPSYVGIIVNHYKDPHGRLRCSIFGRDLARELHPGKVGARDLCKIEMISGHAMIQNTPNEMSKWAESRLFFNSLWRGGASLFTKGFQQSRAKAALFITRKLFLKDPNKKSF